MALTTKPWDTASYLKTKEDIAAYLDVALEDGDPELVKLALGNIARAKGMAEVAEKAGLGRTSLYKALSPKGNPEFATVTSVFKAFGLRLSVAKIAPDWRPIPKTASLSRKVAVRLASAGKASSKLAARKKAARARPRSGRQVAKPVAG